MNAHGYCVCLHAIALVVGEDHSLCQVGMPYGNNVGIGFKLMPISAAMEHVSVRWFPLWGVLQNAL